MKVVTVKCVSRTSLHCILWVIVVFEGCHSSPTRTVNCNSAIGTHVTLELSGDLNRSNIIVSVPSVLNIRKVNDYCMLSCGR